MIMKKHCKRFTADRIVENLPGGVLIYKADRDNEQILYANQEIIHLFDCEDYDDFYKYVKGCFKGCVHPDDYERTEDTIWEHIDNSMLNRDYVIYRIITKKGIIKEVNDLGRLVIDKKYGDLFYVFMHDLGQKVQTVMNASH